MTGPAVLADGELRLEVDPERGAEVRSLRWRGVELLFVAPWPQAPLGPGPHDGEGWTAAWPGGWQLLVPNAGEACSVEGRPYGYHGDASVAPFVVTRRRPDLLEASWRDGHGLVVERVLSVERSTVRAETRLRNAGTEPLPYLLVEHLILGGPLAAEGVAIELPGGTIHRQTWAGEDDGADEAWPGPDGDDWSRLGDVVSRFAIVRDLPHARATVRAPGGPAVELRWSGAGLPHLWLWQERNATPDPPWNGSTACLAVEPAGAPRADGLARAIERGEASWLAPGAGADSWMEITVIEE